MALIGRMSPHTFFSFSENLEMSAWEPYHANRGFSAEQSCVTVATIHGSSPLQHFYGGMIMTWTADGILNNLVDDLILTNRRTLLRWESKGVGKVPGSGAGANVHMIILFPELVSELKKMGYDQTRLQDEIYRRVSVPYEELTSKEIKAVENGMKIGVIPPELHDTFKSALNPGKNVPLLIMPEDIHLFVVGGAPGCAFSFDYHRIPPYSYTAIMTRPVTGAALTKAGV
jgi:hypothetical protein